MSRYERESESFLNRRPKSAQVGDEQIFKIHWTNTLTYSSMSTVTSFAKVRCVCTVEFEVLDAMKIEARSVEDRKLRIRYSSDCGVKGDTGNMPCEAAVPDFTRFDI